ncbi:MAG: radical SAM protein [Candidatus Omnitrophica bacterium]|nr:radical SAM protein [Candidatus Omnitrophota bacterium]
MPDLFESLRRSLKPFFKWIPPFYREKIIYPYITYYTKPLKVPKPHVVVLELSNLCNLNCKICTRPDSDAPVGNMDVALAKDVIKKARDCGIQQLGFHTVGEPLLYPHLKEVLLFAKDVGFPIGISTNANLLTKEKADMLLALNINNIRVSLEGTGEIYNELREKGDFFTAIENIKYIHNKRVNDRSPRISLNYVLTKDSIKSIQDFQKNYAYLFDHITYCPLINQGCVKNPYVENNSVVLLTNDKYPCFNLWVNMYVTFNGEVSVCCVDYNHKLIVGNIQKDSLLNIWNSKQYQSYRRINREGRVNAIPYCKNCTMPVLLSKFYMKRIANRVNEECGTDIKILDSI